MRRAAILVLLVLGCDPGELPVLPGVRDLAARAWAFYGQAPAAIPALEVRAVDCRSPFGPGFTIPRGSCEVGLYDEKTDTVSVADNGQDMAPRLCHELWHAVQWFSVGVVDPRHEFEGWESGGRVDMCTASLRGPR